MSDSIHSFLLHHLSGFVWEWFWRLFLVFWVSLRSPTRSTLPNSPGFRCAKSVATEGPSGVKPHGYRYDNVKKKRPPPGVGDPIKDGGKGAEEMVQAIAAEQGAEGLQKWMDKFGMGGEVRRRRELREPRVPHASQPRPHLSPPTSLISSRR